MIYLMRHGQTDWNLFKRANGITETFLNQTGINQARQLAEKIKDIKFDVCYCSPQIRARQFCEIIYNGHVIFDDRLVELILGDFEGKEETRLMMMQFLLAIKKGKRGLERFDKFQKRTFDLCDEIAEKHKGQNVLIITHAANARVINYYFLGKPKKYSFLNGVCRNNECLTFEN